MPAISLPQCYSSEMLCIRNWWGTCLFLSFVYDVVRNSCYCWRCKSTKKICSICCIKCVTFLLLKCWLIFGNGLFVQVIWNCPDCPCHPLLIISCFIAFVGRFTNLCAMPSYLQQEDSLFATMPPLCPIGSHSKVQSPKSVTGGLGAFTKVFLLVFVPGQGA